MGRPRFPGCVLPANCISSIVAEQSRYDEDPEAYERQEREDEDRRQEELMRDRAAEEEYYRSGGM